MKLSLCSIRTTSVTCNMPINRQTNFSEAAVCGSWTSNKNLRAQVAQWRLMFNQHSLSTGSHTLGICDRKFHVSMHRYSDFSNLYFQSFVLKYFDQNRLLICRKSQQSEDLAYQNLISLARQDLKIYSMRLVAFRPTRSGQYLREKAWVQNMVFFI